MCWLCWLQMAGEFSRTSSCSMRPFLPVRRDSSGKKRWKFWTKLGVCLEPPVIFIHFFSRPKTGGCFWAWNQCYSPESPYCSFCPKVVQIWCLHKSISSGDIPLKTFARCLQFGRLGIQKKKKTNGIRRHQTASDGISSDICHIMCLIFFSSPRGLRCFKLGHKLSAILCIHCFKMVPSSKVPLPSPVSEVLTGRVLWHYWQGCSCIINSRMW